MKKLWYYIKYNLSYWAWMAIPWLMVVSIIAFLLFVATILKYFTDHYKL